MTTKKPVGVSMERYTETCDKNVNNKIQYLADDIDKQNDLL